MEGVFTSSNAAMSLIARGFTFVSARALGSFETIVKAIEMESALHEN